MNISNIKIDESQPERLKDDATPTERLTKFLSIAELLTPENIHVVALDNGCPVLEDKTCGFRMTQNVITWEIFKASEVAEMIINARNDHRVR